MAESEGVAEREHSMHQDEACILRFLSSNARSGLLYPSTTIRRWVAALPTVQIGADARGWLRTKSCR